MPAISLYKTDEVGLDGGELKCIERNSLPSLQSNAEAIARSRSAARLISQFSAGSSVSIVNLSFGVPIFLQLDFRATMLRQCTIIYTSFIFIETTRTRG